MTELLSSLRSSFIGRLTDPRLRGLSETPIVRITSTIQQARPMWGERFNPSMQKRYIRYANNLAKTLHSGRFLHMDSYYLALKPEDHHIAFNLFTQLVPDEEQVPEFVRYWQYKLIEDYFLGAYGHKIRFNNGFEDPNNYQEDFTNYIFYDSDYGDRGKMRMFLKHLIDQQPNLDFLNRERRSGELPYF